MYCTCWNNNATICQSKVNCDFLFSCLKNDISATHSKAEIKIIHCWLIINKPLPNLYSRDTSIQGTLSLVLTVSPEL